MSDIKSFEQYLRDDVKRIDPQTGRTVHHHVLKASINADDQVEFYIHPDVNGDTPSYRVEGDSVIPLAGVPVGESAAPAAQNAEPGSDTEQQAGNPSTDAASATQTSGAEGGSVGESVPTATAASSTDASVAGDATVQASTEATAPNAEGNAPDAPAAAGEGSTAGEAPAAPASTAGTAEGGEAGESGATSTPAPSATTQADTTVAAASDAASSQQA